MAPTRAASISSRLLVTPLVVAAALLVAVAAAAEDSDRRRLYLGLRIGESNPVTKANDVASFSLGANLSRYLGVDFAVDGYELYLDAAGERVGELGILNLVPEVRLRYPLLSDRLTPYILAGAGAAVTQINDSQVPLGWTGGGTTRARPMGAFGAGVEYYVADDIALGVEGKYFLIGSDTFESGGTKTDVDLSAGVLTFGMRAFYPELHPDETAFVASRNERRFYLNVRIGGSLLMHSAIFPGVEASHEQDVFGSNFSLLYGVGVGVQLASWIDLELSGSNYELDLKYPGGEDSEYAVFPVVLQPRFHYRLADPRIDPYVLVGVGAEFVEVNDKSIPEPIDDGGPAVIGVFGAGIDYFVTKDIAFGLETKYTLSRGHTLRIADGPELSGNLDALFVSFGVRAYLFDL